MVKRSRKGTVEVEWNPAQNLRNDSESSRTRYIAGLRELEAIISPASYDKAKHAGVKITQSGFMSRNQLGSTSLTITNSDLFGQLQGHITRIRKDILGQEPQKTGRPPNDDESPTTDAYKLRIKELERLLECALVDNAKLVKLVGEARVEADVLRSKVSGHSR